MIFLDFLVELLDFFLIYLDFFQKLCWNIYPSNYPKGLKDEVKRPEAKGLHLHMAGAPQSYSYWAPMCNWEDTVEGRKFPTDQNCRICIIIYQAPSKKNLLEKNLNWMDARQPSDSWVSTNQKVNLSNDFATFLVLPYNWKFILNTFWIFLNNWNQLWATLSCYFLWLTQLLTEAD